MANYTLLASGLGTRGPGTNHAQTVLLSGATKPALFVGFALQTDANEAIAGEDSRSGLVAQVENELNPGGVAGTVFGGAGAIRRVYAQVYSGADALNDAVLQFVNGPPDGASYLGCAVYNMS